MRFLKTIKRPLSYIHGQLIKLYDTFTIKEVEVSVGDIILQRGEIDHCQFLLSSRMLDVKDFCEHNDKSFKYQNAISRATFGDSHKEELGNTRFASLIESYREKGYDSKSTILVDKECRLIDGNHRMGTNLYFGINNINVRMTKRGSSFGRNIDQYLKMNVATEVIEKIMAGYKDIQEWLVATGNTFCCILKNENNATDIVSDMGFMTDILRVKPLPIGGGVIAQFSVRNPNYVIEDNELVSQRVIVIENIIRRRYHIYTNDNQIIISHNCKRGHELYMEYVESIHS